jgi:hypothetical protein
MKKLIVLMTVLVALAGFTLVTLYAGASEDMDSPAADNSTMEKPLKG